MDEESPLDPPEGNWWDRNVNRRETIWLAISGGWGVSMFGWMMGWMDFGKQNQTGPTTRTSPKRYRQKVQAYKQKANHTRLHGTDVLVPRGNDVYIGAYQWSWDGLPMVIEAGTSYTFHLSSYDVQHGFSVRRASNLSQQVTLQVLPDYEWANEMQFHEPGTFEVVCNEYCGVGHSAMHGVFYVVDSLEGLHVTDSKQSASSGTDANATDGNATDGNATDGNGTNGGGTGVDAWLADADNYDGQVVDRTGQDATTVEVGAQGNGGSFAFAPPALRVSTGTTVTFSWVSSNHNVVVQSQPNGANWSGHQQVEHRGYSDRHTFDTSGLYEYYCAPHESLGMKGVIEVA